MILDFIESLLSPFFGLSGESLFICLLLSLILVVLMLILRG